MKLEQLISFYEVILANAKRDSHKISGAAESVEVAEQTVKCLKALLTLKEM